MANRKRKRIPESTTPVPVRLGTVVNDASGTADEPLEGSLFGPGFRDVGLLLPFADPSKGYQPTIIELRLRPKHQAIVKRLFDGLVAAGVTCSRDGRPPKTYEDAVEIVLDMIEGALSLPSEPAVHPQPEGVQGG
jgi:hypothetical protein